MLNAALKLTIGVFMMGWGTAVQFEWAAVPEPRIVAAFALVGFGIAAMSSIEESK